MGRSSTRTRNPIRTWLRHCAASAPWACSTSHWMLVRNTGSGGRRQGGDRQPRAPRWGLKPRRVGRGSFSLGWARACPVGEGRGACGLGQLHLRPEPAGPFGWVVGGPWAAWKATALLCCAASSPEVRPGAGSSETLPAAGGSALGLVGPTLLLLAWAPRGSCPHSLGSRSGWRPSCPPASLTYAVSPPGLQAGDLPQRRKLCCGEGVLGESRQQNSSAQAEVKPTFVDQV